MYRQVLFRGKIVGDGRLLGNVIEMGANQHSIAFNSLEYINLIVLSSESLKLIL